MNEIETYIAKFRLGRRVPKNWTIPLPMVELIEKRAEAQNESESRVAEDLMFIGIQMEHQQAETE